MTEEETPTVSEVEQALRDLEEKESRERHPTSRDETVNVFGTETPTSDEDQAAHRLTEIAEEVLRGEWGSGQSRRLKLAEAGFDPVEVQREMVRVANRKT